MAADVRRFRSAGYQSNRGRCRRVRASKTRLDRECSEPIASLRDGASHRERSTRSVLLARRAKFGIRRAHRTSPQGVRTGSSLKRIAICFAVGPRYVVTCSRRASRDMPSPGHAIAQCRKCDGDRPLSVRISDVAQPDWSKADLARELLCRIYRMPASSCGQIARRAIGGCPFVCRLLGWQSVPA